MYYVREAGKLRKVDVVEWGLWMQTADRVVDRTEVSAGLFVSTVFLGLDHGFSSGHWGPILFETMVVDDQAEDCRAFWDDIMVRYATEEDAMEGHAWVCGVVRLAVQSANEDGIPTEDRERLRGYVVGYYDEARSMMLRTNTWEPEPVRSVRVIRLGTGPT